MGYTQEAFATRLRVERSTVARWERGVSTPQPWNQPDVAKALGISVELLEQYLAQKPTTAIASDRLGFVLQRPASLDLAAVAQLRQQLQTLDDRYDRAPSIPLLVDASHTFGQIAFLAKEAPRGRARRELKAAEAEAATLVGQLIWDASQRRDHRSARSYFDQAVAAARELGDVTAEGHALLRTSYLCLYGDRDPQAGLALTQYVATTTAASSSVLTGLAHLHSAEAHAMLGDTRSCEMMLTKAEGRFTNVVATDPAIHLFSENQFARLAGSCYLFLGQYRRAQQILQKAACVTRKPSKSRAIVLGNLSLAQLRQGELDAATAALHETIDILETTRGGGGLTIAFDAGRELRRWRTEPLVQDVYDRLLSLMAAA